MGYCGYIYPPPYDISVHGLSFWETDWTSCHGPLLSDLHTKIRISAGVFQAHNWFPLQCLGPWMNHLSPIWWSTFRFIFLNDSWCVIMMWLKGIFYWLLPLFLSFPITHVLPIIFLLKWLQSEISEIGFYPKCTPQMNLVGNVSHIRINKKTSFL